MCSILGLIDFEKNCKNETGKIFELNKILTCWLSSINLFFKIFIFPNLVPSVTFLIFFFLAIYFIFVNSLLSSSVIILEFLFNKFLNKYNFELK